MARVFFHTFKESIIRYAKLWKMKNKESYSNALERAKAEYALFSQVGLHTFSFFRSSLHPDVQHAHHSQPSSHLQVSYGMNWYSSRVARKLLIASLVCALQGHCEVDSWSYYKIVHQLSSFVSHSLVLTHFFSLVSTSDNSHLISFSHTKAFLFGWLFWLLHRRGDVFVPWI